MKVIIVDRWNWEYLEYRTSPFTIGKSGRGRTIPFFRKHKVNGKMQKRIRDGNKWKWVDSCTVIGDKNE
jgi:hypothetical protein